MKTNKKLAPTQIIGIKMHCFFRRKYYFQVKRLEDGFDLSSSDCPRLDHPPTKAVSNLYLNLLCTLPSLCYCLSSAVIMVLMEICISFGCNLHIIYFHLKRSSSFYSDCKMFLLGFQRPTLNYNGLHDRPLKHYFNHPDVKVTLTQFKAVSSQKYRLAQNWKILRNWTRFSSQKKVMK